MTGSPGAARADLPPAAGGASEVASDGLIRQMPDVLASKIAAGEVVQRPASVAKELLENAIDAGARRVELVLKRAGSALIQVVDDGCGMGPADAEAAFARHATSKLRSFDDLERLATLGFRGEALASIAAVARVELKTRRMQDAAGTCVRVDGGRVVERAPCAAEAGTSIAVRDLFYNVPARRAFLKAPATEFRHVVDAFQGTALSEPAVAFGMVHDGMDVYRLGAPPEGASFEEALAQRVAALFEVGPESLITVGESTSYLSLRGFVGRPENARKGKGAGFLFVNGRVVRHRGLEHAVLQSYGALIPEGRRPFFALFLDVDPRHVDVNVHPSKTEVKFDDEGGVYSFVRAVVKRGLGAADLALAWEAPAGLAPDFEAAGARARWEAPASAFDPPAGDGGWRAEASPALPQSPIPSRTALGPPAAGDEANSTGGSIWPLHGRYLLTAIRSGMLVVDQQAAHERILYEAALTSLGGGLAASQQLLFPQSAVLSPADHALMKELLPDLRALGFALDVGAGRTVVVRGVPADVHLGAEDSVLQDVLAGYREVSGGPADDRRVALARAFARRSAVRRGDPLKPAEARTLVGSSRVDLQACKLEYSIVSPK